MVSTRYAHRTVIVSHQCRAFSAAVERKHLVEISQRATNRPQHRVAQEARPSHYYAARNTNSSPLQLSTQNGDESEKFLFYRGVSVVPAPLSALVLPNGQIEAMNQSSAEVAKLILFERRDEKIGFREVNTLREGAVLDPPILDASLALDSLLSDLETSLISSGLYPEEAHAMLESWKDSWFEEGSRLIYIVPSSFVETILPLSIEPQPATTHRVFVGRMELLTPATRNAIETAVETNDKVTLAKYGRFLGPMIESLLRKATDPVRTAQLNEALRQIYVSYVAQNQLR
jgi:hypothetical protein